MRTIAVANHKGGSGKTTTTVNLAAALAEQGQRVLVIDMDPIGAASWWLGGGAAEHGVGEAVRGRSRLAELVYETTAPGVGLVPSSPELTAAGREEEIAAGLGFLRAMEDLPAIWDFVLVDCAATLGYLSIAPLSACNEVLVPVEAHILAISGLAELIEVIERIQRRLNPALRLSTVLACRVNHTAHARTIVDRLQRRFPDELLHACVRESIRLAEAPSFQLPITRYAPASSGSVDYRAAAAELRAQVRTATPSV